MKRFATLTAIVAATLVGVAVAWYLRAAVLIFFISLATAAAMRPFAEGPAFRRWPRTAAIATTYVLAVGGLCLLGLLTVGPLGEDIEQFAADFAPAYRDFFERWSEGAAVEQAIAQQLPSPEQISLNSDAGGNLQAVLLGVLMVSIETIVNAALVIVLSLYWSFDRVRFERLWLSLLGADVRAQARDIWRTIETEVGRYLQSEIVQCIAAGLLLGLGFAAMGQPYPVLLATIGAIAWLIPWVGAPLAVTAVILLTLPATFAQDASWAVVVGPAAIYTLGVLVFLEFVVEPRLYHRHRYNTLLVALVVIGLADLLGVLGVLLGPPLAAAIQILGDRLLRPASANVPQSAPPPASLNDRLDELRVMLLQGGQPRPEVISLVDRLESLLDDAQNAPVNAVARAAEGLSAGARD